MTGVQTCALPIYPIEGATDGEAEEHETAADVHRVSRPSEHARRREHQCRLRRSNVCANVPKNAIGSDHHPKADNESNSADHNSSREWKVGEQIQWHKEVKDNPHY